MLSLITASRIGRNEPRKFYLAKPPNGLALAAVLRGQHADLHRGAPAAFLLRSAHLDDLLSPFPPTTCLQAIAHLYNLEWVHDKSSDLDVQVRQISSLAAAMKAAPRFLADG